MKLVSYKDLEDLVYSIELTFDELIAILDIKYFAGSTIGFTLPPGLYEIIDLILMLKSLTLDVLKVDIPIDDIRRRSVLRRNKTLKFI